MLHSWKYSFCCGWGRHAHVKELGGHVSAIDIQNPNSQRINLLNIRVTGAVNHNRERILLYMLYKSLLEKGATSSLRYKLFLFFVMRSSWQISLSEKMLRKSGVRSSAIANRILCCTNIVTTLTSVQIVCVNKTRKDTKSHCLNILRIFKVPIQYFTIKFYKTERHLPCQLKDLIKTERKFLRL